MCSWTQDTRGYSVDDLIRGSLFYLIHDHHRPAESRERGCEFVETLFRNAGPQAGFFIGAIVGFFFQGDVHDFHGAFHGCMGIS